MKTKTIRISSRFPAPIDVIWEKLQQVETLQYIAAPYATFKSVGDTPLVWTEGETIQFSLKLFGLFCLGVHSILVKQFVKEKHTIYTTESNKYVPVWNHRIVLKPTYDYLVTEYTDEVEVFAGWKTSIVAAWSRMFYKHRQKKWLALLHDSKMFSEKEI